MIEHRDHAGSEDQRGGFPHTRTELLNPNDVTPHPAGPVTLDDREGVFAHSFKCGACQLEFALLSWVRDRHTAGNTCCPECGQITPKIYWRATLSEHRDFIDDGSSPEIFNVIPLGSDARLVSLPERA